MFTGCTFVGLTRYVGMMDTSETRKSKTEAVLQRRSMLKLGVICKYMKRYGKC